MNFKDKMGLALADFGTKKRGEETITVVADDSKTLDLVRECHGGRDYLPNDWVFDRCCSILEVCLDYDFETLEELQEYQHEIVDGMVSIYNHELIEWSRTFYGYVDQASEEFGPSKGFISGLQAGQYYQLDQMFRILTQGIEDAD